MDVLENIKKMLEEQKKTQIELCTHLGLQKQAFTDWNGGKSKSYLQFIPQIAEFFGVSISELYGESIPDLFKAKPASVKHELPVYGDVSAGTGVVARQSILGWESADEQYDEDDGWFYLLVTGDSMSPLFNEGDYVLVHSQDYIESGEIAVVVVNGEGYVKKIEKGRNHITLISENPYYPPRRFEGADMCEVHILGHVVEMKRKFK